MKKPETLLLLLFLMFCVRFPVVAQQSAVTYKDGHYHVIKSIAEKGSNLVPFANILEWQHFRTSVHSRDVPKPVRQFYHDVAEDAWQMADTGADYNCCCDRDKRLPNRQLLYLGYNDNIVLLSYIHGLGSRGAVMIAVFRLEGGKVIDFCIANVGRYIEEPLSREVLIQQLRQLVKDGEQEADLDDM